MHQDEHRHTSPSPAELAKHRVVSQDEWTRERLKLLEREKELMKLQDELSVQQRALPWVKVDKKYTFTDATGDLTLADLFDGRSQFFIKHLMMGPEQDWQCQGCSLEVDHVAGLLVHMEHSRHVLRRSCAGSD